jgi:hypothetical protein
MLRVVQPISLHQPTSESSFIKRFIVFALIRVYPRKSAANTYTFLRFAIVA